ncbi:hypothetical protein A0H81_02525 [Grifola frondosa]|uniref:Uncharacterized protein n=1 Tax=Grifola frondosa TaxID=5627 RepID=A0A1C7MMG6_GRIFR|nr:hypothetical protein A0H81_02525 [Grifola frondosa]
MAILQGAAAVEDESWLHPFHPNPLDALGRCTRSFARIDVLWTMVSQYTDAYWRVDLCYIAEHGLPDRPRYQVRKLSMHQWSITELDLLKNLEYLKTTHRSHVDIDRRVSVQAHHNCTAGNVPSHLSVWLYYLVTMVYDVVTLGISSFYLLRFKPPAGSRMSHLVKVMLHDGLVYFIALTGVNIFNLILYRTTDETTQSSGASLGYTITWIMSQRILIHLRDAAAEHNRMPTTHIVVSRPLTSARSVSQAMRSQFESKVRIDDHFSTSGVVVVSHAGEEESRVSDLDLEHGDFDVQVQIEESVAVEYDSQAFERESYRTPRLMWEERSRAS